MHSISHLAIIMDGNRRWAKKQGLTFSKGYADGGLSAVKRSIEFCLEQGIKHLSLYAFSIENLKRPQQEQNFLFNTIINEGPKEIDTFCKQGIHIKFVGDQSLFPKHVIPTCQKIERETKDGTNLFLNILFCYGGRQEIIHSVKKLCSLVKKGVLSEEQISESTLTSHLWTAGTPEPELIIRTSGTQRLSNFLLYQAAYSELFFIDCLWPEITKEKLKTIVNKFLDTTRNFGI